MIRGMRPHSGLALTALVAFVAATGPASAQSTRAEVIAAQQSEKAEHLGAEGPSTGEQITVRIMSSPLLSGSGGPYPWFGSVFGGSGFAAGGGYLKRLPRNASINGVAGISINGSTLVDARGTLPEVGRHRLRFDVGVQRVDAKAVAFYGIGPDTTKDNRHSYRYRPVEFSGDVTGSPLASVHVVAGYSYLSLHATPDDGVGPQPRETGFNRDVDFNVARVEGRIDTRATTGYATRGTLLRARWERHDETAGRRFSFNSAEYEVGRLTPLFAEQYVIAVRALVTTTDADTGDEVPVPLLPYLGSGSTLRGFGNRRFADRNRVLLNAEYRWRPSRYLDMAIFVDAGQVAPKVGQFSWERLETSWGIGARFHGPTFTAFRAELARSREGWKAVFGGGLGY